MGSNKHLQRGYPSYPKTGELTHLWKPSSPFTAYLALMPLPSGKMDFNQVVPQTSRTLPYTSRKQLYGFHATPSKTCLLGQNLITYVVCPVHSPLSSDTP